MISSREVFYFLLLMTINDQCHFMSIKSKTFPLNLNCILHSVQRSSAKGPLWQMYSITGTLPCSARVLVACSVHCQYLIPASRLWEKCRSNSPLSNLSRVFNLK